MVTIPGIDSVNFAGGLASTMYYVGYALVTMIITAALGAGYYFLSFGISAKVTPVYGTGKEGQLTFGTTKNNRFKWVKKRKAWRALYPLFNKKDIEPFDAEFIYPKNKVYGFKYGDNIIPGKREIKLSVKDKDGEITSMSEIISPVPYYIRNWQSLQYKKNQSEFSELSFFEQNKYFIAIVLTALVCLAAVVATVYLSYKFAGAGRADAQMISDAIKSFGAIPGK